MKLSTLFSAAPKTAQTPEPPSPEQTRRAAELLDEPMGELLRAWITAINGHPERWQGRLRGHASSEQCEQLAQRLGAPVPRQLLAFYQACNGVTPMSDEFPHLLLPIQALVRGDQHRPPLSRQCAQHLPPPGSEGATPIRLNVACAPLLPTTAAIPASGLTPADTDGLLALEVPRQGRALTMVIDERLGFAPGVVLDIEGTQAVCHDSLAHWLASQAALHGRSRLNA